MTSQPPIRFVIDVDDMLWLNPADCIAHVWECSEDTARRMWSRVSCGEHVDVFRKWCGAFSRSSFFRYEYREEVYDAFTSARTRRGTKENVLLRERWLAVTEAVRQRVTVFPALTPRCRGFRELPPIPFVVGQTIDYNMLQTYDVTLEEEKSAEEEEKDDAYDFGADDEEEEDDDETDCSVIEDPPGQEVYDPNLQAPSGAHMGQNTRLRDAVERLSRKHGIDDSHFEAATRQFERKRKSKMMY